MIHVHLFFARRKAWRATWILPNFRPGCRQRVVCCGSIWGQNSAANMPGFWEKSSNFTHWRSKTPFNNPIFPKLMTGKVICISSCTPSNMTGAVMIRSTPRSSIFSSAATSWSPITKTQLEAIDHVWDLVLPRRSPCPQRSRLFALSHLRRNCHQLYANCRRS
jgi:hypothetical protein